MSRLVLLDDLLCDLLQRSGTFTDSVRQIVHALAKAGEQISQKVHQGALANILGNTQQEQENVQGEIQKKLDLLANDILIEACQHAPAIVALASEEMETIHIMEHADPLEKAAEKYLLLVDPLDGSSNIDVNVSIGTIFSVLRLSSDTPMDRNTLSAAFLQPGTQQVAAGYILYGPQTMLVLSVGCGVDGFTLDPIQNAWVHTHPNLRIPESTQEFAINTSNERHWYAPVQRYIAELKAGKSGPRQSDFNMRWIASMVADIHRILMRGGIFMYPADLRNPSRPGRLRLMYEASPMAFLIEQAGGAATDGRKRLLEKVPTALHERIAVFVGSKNEVERVTRYHTETTETTETSEGTN